MRQFLILGIFIYIYRSGKTTTKEIAERFEVSPRTVYRYINSICEAGVPIITKAGYGGGVYIMDGFKLESLFYTEDERRKIEKALA
ncbi:MAG TPA: HTH domain-containing protein [Candidatus Caccopulliclostridium gallistercoris]|uniref:HTH domain-containing protein n=1 Tax=Candidatus Caccopulliclostridium gallistercoris TaxID=2840719 RepID=A0A9D1SYJ6_9FIRM|nr:HTH domain-containing protein [Candidatus Caccopulliclostridium gallistercoris]